MGEKAYICELDGRSFETEQEVLDYMLGEYVEEIEPEEGSLNDIQQQLKKALPGFDFVIAKRPHTYKEERLGSEEDLWFTGKSILFGTIKSNSCMLENVHFSIKTPYEHRIQEDQHEFETVEQVIAFYQRFLFGANQFSTAILHEIQLYDQSFVDCVVTKIVQSNGISESFNEYHYKFIREDGSSTPLRYLELDSYDLESDELLQREIEKCIQGIKADYILSVEGLVTFHEPKDQNDHNFWYEVDGISIESFAKRANHLRVEILENKEGGSINGK